MALDSITPWYSDWTMWSFVVAFAALALSVIPYLRRFSKARLEIDVYQRIFLTHKVGNPNAQLQVMLTNTGGKRVRVRGMSLDMRRAGEAAFTLKAITYLHSPNDSDGILLAPFSLQVEQEWGHLVNFYQINTQQDQRTFRNFQKAIRDNIRSQRVGMPDSAPDVAAPPELAAPALEYFNRKFKWYEGEYEVTLNVSTDADLAPAKKLRLTIFEIDSRELEDCKNQLQFGRDILGNEAPGAIVELTERA